MGRHTAADGASAHPLVAAALAQRPADVTGAHRGEPAPTSSDVGWPAPPQPTAPEPGDGAVGWPGGSGQDDQDTAAVDGREQLPPRRGWRRLFGAGRAA